MLYFPLRRPDLLPTHLCGGPGRPVRLQEGLRRRLRGIAIGYFLIGAMGMPAFQGLYPAEARFTLLIPILVFTAMFGSFIKPSVLGTVAATTTPQSKSLGYALYYWIVNMGGALGPSIAYFVRNHLGIGVRVRRPRPSAARHVVANFLFYREVRGDAPEERDTLRSKIIKPGPGAEEPAVHDVSPDLFPVLDYVLADLRDSPLLPQGQSHVQRRPLRADSCR